MPEITDPAIQAQLKADTEAGIVPKWNANSLDEAQAFVDYFNALTESDRMELVTVTTYQYKINPPTS